MKRNRFYLLAASVALIISFIDYTTFYLTISIGSVEFYNLETHIFLLIIWLIPLLVTHYFFQTREKTNQTSQKSIIKNLLLSLVINFGIFLLIQFMARVIFAGGNINLLGYLMTVFERFFRVGLPVTGIVATYHYYNLNVSLKEDLVKKATANRIAEIKILKQQIAPHFLFNNLNIVSSLIRQDIDLADDYIIKLGNIYRYIVDNTDVLFVPLAQEIRQIKDYFYLLEQRYKNIYYMVIESSLTNQKNVHIIPNTLQILIENVIKHNYGSEKNPLNISIKISSEELSITNKKQLKPAHHENRSATGLKNLKERYKLLTGKNVIIKENEHSFKVIIPLIKEVNDAGVNN